MHEVPRHKGLCPLWLGAVFAMAGAGTAFADAERSGTTTATLARTTISGEQVRAQLPARNPSPTRITVRGPLQIVVSVGDQRADVYRGTQLISSTRVSTGRRGYATPQGVFSIIQKNRRHYSNIYGGAPMPFMQRLTWSGVALHAGYVPNYPASHGCIRLPPSFASWLFSTTDMGNHVVVAEHRPAPRVVDYAGLFQPRPRPQILVEPHVPPLVLTDHTNPLLSEADRSAHDDARTRPFVTALRHAFHPNADAHQRELIRLAQKLLGRLGYDIRYADGSLGRNTRGAISRFQRAEGMRISGRVSSALIDRAYWRLAETVRDMPREEQLAILTPEDIDEPLRILVTRAKQRNETRDAQQMLAELGFDPGDPDGLSGRQTIAAVKAYQRDAGLTVSGLIDETLLDALAKATGRQRSRATGHLYVRRGQRDIYDAPVEIADLDRELGTHLFIMTDEKDDSGRVLWTTISPQKRAIRVANADDSAAATASLIDGPRAALARIEIPEDVRIRVEQMLTPASSLVIADGGWLRETGDYTDFIVETR